MEINETSIGTPEEREQVEEFAETIAEEVGTITYEYLVDVRSEGNGLLSITYEEFPYFVEQEGLRLLNHGYAVVGTYDRNLKRKVIFTEIEPQDLDDSTERVDIEVDDETVRERKKDLGLIEAHPIKDAIEDTKYEIVNHHGDLGPGFASDHTNFVDVRYKPDRSEKIGATFFDILYEEGYRASAVDDSINDDATRIWLRGL